MKKLLVLVLCLIASVYYAFSQPEIPVNLFSGAPEISIPFGSIDDDGVADHFGMRYNPKGVSIKSTSGYFGTGWDLYGGDRKISREVRGLPDDGPEGWIYSGLNETIGSFGNSSDLSSSTCSDEQADYNQLLFFNFSKDTEPDLFHYHVPGHSGSFVFDNTSAQAIRLIPYEDIKIEPLFGQSTGKKILAFRITSNDGNVYEFTANSTSYESKRAIKYPSTSTVELAKTEYALYDETSVRYTTEWALDRISSPSGSFITYNYIQESYPFKYDYQPDHTITARFVGYGQHQYGWEISNYSVRKLASVKCSSGQSIEFVYENINNANPFHRGVLTRVSLFDSRRPQGLTKVKEYILEYAAVACGTILNDCDPPGVEDDRGVVDYSNFKRIFLRYITERSGCEKLPPYEFFYNQTDLVHKTTVLPKPNSLSIDFWGYYNGRNVAHLAPKIFIYPDLPPNERYRVFPIRGYTNTVLEMEGSDRTVNSDAIIAGVLTMIKYPTGGRSILEFEPNEFYDPIAHQSFFGGGLRIKSVSYADGLKMNAAISRHYEYKEVNGRSSGRISYKPSYVVPLGKYRKPDGSLLDYDALIQEEKNPWTYLTAHLDVDLAPPGNVGYERVKVSVEGSGYSVFEYDFPGAWGDTSIGDWNPSLNKFARSADCPKLISGTGGEYSFPYAPNPDNSYEQGLLRRKQEFNDLNAIVSQTDIEYKPVYQAGNAPHRVYGLRYEQTPNDLNAFYYSKYSILTGSNKVVGRETHTIYNETNAAKRISTTKDYFYESTQHKYLTSVRTAHSDGSVYSKFFKYPADYGVIPLTVDKHSLMINKLQEFRKGYPIEVYETVQRNGGAIKIMSGALNTYDDFGGVLPLLQYQFALRPMDINLFTPSRINSTTGVFEYDHDGYELVSAVKSYWHYKMPSCQVGQDKIIKTTLWGYNNTTPVAIVRGASPEEVAFSGFDTWADGSFSIHQAAYSGFGRNGSFGVSANCKISKALTKTSNNYIVSGWIKSSLPVTLTVSFTGTTGTPALLTKTFTIEPTSSSRFRYFEYEIPFNIQVEKFLVTVSSSYTAPSKFGAVLDDIAVFPAHATISVYNYFFPYGLSGVTSKSKTSGNTYNDLGMIMYSTGIDENILEANELTFSERGRNYLDAYFEAIPLSSSALTVSFQAIDNCIPGTTYSWSFDSSVFTEGSAFMKHTFQSYGNKLVRLRVQSPGHGIREYQRIINPADFNK